MSRKLLSSIRGGQGQSDQELRDLREAVEHIVAVGSKVRHDNWRRKEWQNRKRQRNDHQEQFHHEDNAADPASESTKMASMISSKSRNNILDNVGSKPTYLHAEDTRIYGRNGFPRKPWPILQKHIDMEGRNSPNVNKSSSAPLHVNNDDYQTSDNQWNIEHGDTIQPIAFSTARLSNSTQKSSDDDTKTSKVTDGPNLNIETTEVTLTDNQIPRALVLRCWERAVHASSCTMLVSPYQLEQNVTSKSSEISSEINDLSYVESTKAKCKLLNIALPSVNPPYVCSLCQLTWKTFQELEQHFYGDCRSQHETNNNRQNLVTGCCWRSIKIKQQAMIDHVLQQHVKAHIDQLLDLIMKQSTKQTPSAETVVTRQQIDESDEYASKPTSATTMRGSRKRQKRLSNWHDILQLLESTIKDSFSCCAALVPRNSMESQQRDGTTKQPVVVETLETEYNKSPLVFNQSVLEAIRQRLLDRYADVPF